MRITVDAARGYFRHPSQRVLETTPDNLPDVGFEYWASGPLCIVFHPSLYPDVWMGHTAAKPEGWGLLVPHAKKLINEFWDEKMPHRIIGWTPEKNRAALAFVRRAGFVVDGRLPLPGGAVIMSGWSK